MPLFEYRCEDCGALFEKLVARADEPVSCVRCQGNRVKKQFSVFAAQVAEGRGGPSGESCNSCGVAQQGMCGMKKG